MAIQCNADVPIVADTDSVLVVEARVCCAIEEGQFSVPRNIDIAIQHYAIAVAVAAGA